MREKITNGIWRISYGTTEDITPAKLFFKDSFLDRIHSRGEAYPFDKDITFNTTARGITVSIPIGEDEKIYGFGLQLNGFMQNENKLKLKTNADATINTGDSHAPVPLYVSNKGYCVYADTARHIDCYIGSSHRCARTKTGETGNEIKTNVDELYVSQKMSDEVVMEISVAKGIDIYVFAGEDMKESISLYNMFCGGGFIPPLWGMGVLYRAYAKADEQYIDKLAKQLCEDKIPCSMIGLEPGWQTHAYACSLKWDDERFPHYEEMIKKLADKNIKLNLWEHAFLYESSPIYNEMLKCCGDHTTFGGIVPDFASDEAKQIFGDYHGMMIDKGVAAFKLDECDGSDFTGGWSYPDYAKFGSGMDGEQAHNLYGMLYQNVIYSEYKKRNTRTYGQVRASGAFAASMPFVLYSDLYEHNAFIRGTVNMGFSGLMWTPEVRQCDSEEELLRRIGSTVFSPLALINSWMIPLPPWKQYDYEKNLKGEVLEESVQLTEKCRKLLNMRMEFIPYLYTAFAKYYLQGIPPFRALVVDYPKDENTFDIDNEYLMGDDIIVAPLTAKESERTVYLPEGEWYGVYSGVRYEGQKHYNIKCAPDEIPLFIKNNRILPLARPYLTVNKDTVFEIEPRAYGDLPQPFYLYEDDGETFEYMNGKYSFAKLEAVEGRIVLDSKHKRYVLINDK